MAWKYYNNDNDDGMSSKYNEAFLKMRRFDDIQKSINLAMINPLAVDMEKQAFNYEMIIRLCGSLLSEVWSKLGKADRIEALKYKKALEIIMKKYPVAEKKFNALTNKFETKLNERNWDIIEKFIFEYQLTLRDYMGKTAYDSPNDEVDWDSL